MALHLHGSSFDSWRTRMHLRSKHRELCPFREFGAWHARLHYDVALLFSNLLCHLAYWPHANKLLRSIEGSAVVACNSYLWSTIWFICYSLILSLLVCLTSLDDLE